MNPSIIKAPRYDFLIDVQKLKKPFTTNMFQHHGFSSLKIFTPSNKCPNL